MLYRRGEEANFASDPPHRLAQAGVKASGDGDSDYVRRHPDRRVRHRASALQRPRNGIHCGGHVLMGTDTPESMGMRLTQGNNVYINLEPDTRAETERLYAALSEGGTVEMPLQEMFWGGYFASLMDRFGTRWMLNCASKT